MVDNRKLVLSWSKRSSNPSWLKGTRCSAMLRLWTRATSATVSFQDRRDIPIERRCSLMASNARRSRLSEGLVGFVVIGTEGMGDGCG